MLVSMVALGTGCSTKSRVAISGCVDLKYVLTRLHALLVPTVFCIMRVCQHM